MNCSDLPRFMQCRSFPTLAESAPAFERSESESKRESEAARYALALMLGNPSGNVQINGITCPNGYIVQQDMADRLKAIHDYIRSRDPSAHLYQLAKIDWSVPRDGDHFVISGIADSIGWNDETRTMYVDDLKYGYRLAEVDNNFQLIGYAIGAMLRYGHMPDRVIMTIHQPRAWHPDGPTRSAMIDRQGLADGHKRIVAQINATSTVCNPGRECYGCPAAGVCPSAAAAAMAALDLSMDATSETVDNDRLGAELRMLEHAEVMLKIRKKALSEMTEHRIRNGQSVNGWTLKESISNRQWSEGVTAQLIQQMTCIDVSDDAIISPSQAEKKGVPKAIIDSFTVRKSNGFKLVQSDTNKDAAKLFGG